MSKSAFTGTSLQATSEVQPRVRESVAAATVRGFVCMIAYTNYAVDARVQREAETLAAAGYRVLCLATKNSATAAHFTQQGVEVRELGVLKYRGKSRLAYIGSYLRFLFVSSAACLRLLIRGELDVIHVHNLPDFLAFAGLVPRVCKSKVVLDVHDSVPEMFATKFSDAPLLWKLLCLEERVSALVAHKVICVNAPQRDVLVARGISKAKTFISMNVPDPKIFAPVAIAGRKDGKASGGIFNLVYHGTMVERLGIDLLIRAVALLTDRIPGVRLNLWGGGDDLPAFQTLAVDLGVDDRVLFSPKGFPLQELPRHLMSMDVGVVGNRRTTAGDLMLPVKLMEYVSLGIPTVVPRLRAIEHYFSGDMVSYYSPDDVQSLADAIHRLYSEPERRRCQAELAAQFLEEYGWQRQGIELVTFYRDLLEDRTP
jgi:glycosyltransferase involved in cell wall biosynthesis